VIGQFLTFTFTTATAHYRPRIRLNSNKKNRFSEMVQDVLTFIDKNLSNSFKRNRLNVR